MILQDKDLDFNWTYFWYFVLILCHVTFKLRVFHLWQKNFASYEESTGSRVQSWFSSIFFALIYWEMLIVWNVTCADRWDLMVVTGRCEVDKWNCSSDSDRRIRIQSSRSNISASRGKRPLAHQRAVTRLYLALGDCVLWCVTSSRGYGVPRRHSHHCSGLATLPSVGAVP